jgi:Zn-dependent peptidase ImmA (M78 family)/transcriptional regulator with XRE-family HTH domain
MPVQRDVLARALRGARENRGISREVAAKRLRLSRTVLAQIELGNRRVSDDELGRFGALYNISIADLTGTELPRSDELEVIVFELAPELLLDERTKARVSHVLDLLRVASSLEEALGRRARGALHYSEPSPGGAADAIAQGEQVAEQERLRLGLLGAPLGSVVELVSSQGVRVSTLGLPEGFSGFFLRHADVGSAVLVSSGENGIRRRFSVLHAYAHGLFERGNAFRTTKRSNADELIAKRANAFAAAFLLPETGIRELLGSLGKGHGSRKEYVVLDIATDEPIRAEHRTAPWSQTITYADIAAIAGRFGASCKATVLRLLSLGIISDAESEALLSAEQQRAAERCLAVTDAREERDEAPQDDRRGLKAEVVYLAIECFRRELIKRDRLAEIAEMLRLPDLPKAKLLELAEAAR